MYDGKPYLDEPGIVLKKHKNYIICSFLKDGSIGFYSLTDEIHKKTNNFPYDKKAISKLQQGHKPAIKDMMARIDDESK